MILYHYSVGSYKSGEPLIEALADGENRIVAEIPIR